MPWASSHRTNLATRYPIHLCTDSSSSRSRRNIFPFLSLPAELRIQIYEEALIVPIEIDATYRKPSPQPFLVPAAFLRTCRQIYSEANRILYEQNTFRVGSMPDDANYGIAWLSRIGDNVKTIRKVFIDIHKNKTESRVLPFTVFLFELRSAAPQLEELGVFVEKHRGSVLTGQIMIINELQKFNNLKTLTLGGEWKSFLGTWPESVYDTLKAKHEHVYFVEVGSEAWVERQDRRKVWQARIAKEADEILWRIGLGRIELWAEAKTRGLSDDLKIEWERWLEDCLYAKGEEARKLTIQRGKQIVLNSKAYSEKQARQVRCNCRDCEWVRENGHEWDNNLDCFAIHERAEIGMGYNDRALKQRDIEKEKLLWPGCLSSATVGKTWEALKGKADVESMGKPADLPRYSDLSARIPSLKLERKKGDDIKKWREDVMNFDKARNAEIAIEIRGSSPAGPSEENMAHSRLRRETRHWYGRPPISKWQMRQ